MKPRLQRLNLKLEPIPGALPQAVDDGAPLALNRYRRAAQSWNVAVRLISLDTVAGRVTHESLSASREANCVERAATGLSDRRPIVGSFAVCGVQDDN